MRSGWSSTTRRQERQERQHRSGAPGSRRYCSMPHLPSTAAHALCDRSCTLQQLQQLQELRLWVHSERLDPLAREGGRKVVHTPGAWIFLREDCSSEQHLRDPR